MPDTPQQTVHASSLPIGKPGISACLSFVDTRAGLETWLGLFNYQLGNYGCTSVKLSAYVVPAPGESELKLLWQAVSDKPNLFSLRVNDWLTEFCGNLVLIAEQSGGRPSPPILQSYKAFRFSDGSLTSQHSEGPLVRMAPPVEHWGYDLEPGYEDIELIFQNHSICESDEATIEFFDASGRALNEQYAATVPPLGWHCVRIPEALPLVARAMRDGRLTARVRHKLNPQRPLYRIHDCGKFILNHASGTTDTLFTKPRGQITRYPVSEHFLGEIYPLLPLDGRDDISAFVDNFFYPEEPYAIAIQVFDQQGRPVGLEPAFAQVPPRGVVELTAQQVLQRFELPASFRGHCILGIGGASDGLSPRGRITQSVRVRGRKTGSMINGGYVMNTQKLAGDRGLGGRRNRTFSPVWATDAVATELVLFNNSSFTEYQGSAAYQLNLYGSNGLVSSSNRRIGNGQMQRIDMAGEIREELAQEHREPLMWAEVRSVEAQIPGLCLHRMPGWTDIDHMFGG